MIAQFAGTEEGRTSSISKVLLGRTGSVESVSYSAQFLASDESSSTTGAELVIDGGAAAEEITGQ